MTLLPLLVATELVENSSFLFAAGAVAQGLAGGPQAFALVLAAYAAGSMVMIGLQQWLSRHLGYRRYLLASLGLFVLGALGSLLSHSLGGLLLARLVQGLGGGALFTSGRILVVLLFSRDDRPRALRRFIALLFGLGLLGPALAAALLQGAGWQAVFAAPLPLALISLLGVWRLLPDGVGRSAEPVRWHAGPVLALVAAAAALQLALSELRALPQLRLAPWAGLALAGLLLLAALGWRQRHHAQPLLHWRGLHHPGYLSGLAMYALYDLIASASGALLPVLAAQHLGLGMPTVGLLACLGALASWLAALAYLRHGARASSKRRLMAGGAVAMALACGWLAAVPAGAAWWQLLPAVLVKGVFGALFVLPLAGLTFRDLDDQRFAPGYQAKNLVRHLALPLGAALVAGGLVRLEPTSAVPSGPASPARLMHANLELFAALALACLVLAAWTWLQRRWP